MNSMNKILVAYIGAIIVVSLEFFYFASIVDPERYDLSLYWFLLSFTLMAAIFSPFIILTWFAYTKKKPILQSIAKGMILWIFSFLLPFGTINLLTIVSGGNFSSVFIYVFAIVQVFLGVYLVSYFSLPKSFAFPAILLPGVFNLYLLVYGIFKRRKF